MEAPVEIPIVDLIVADVSRCGSRQDRGCKMEDRRWSAKKMSANCCFIGPKNVDAQNMVRFGTLPKNNHSTAAFANPANNAANNNDDDDDNDEYCYCYCYYYYSSSSCCCCCCYCYYSCYTPQRWWPRL